MHSKSDSVPGTYRWTVINSISKMQFCFSSRVRVFLGAGEMSQWFKALVVLPRT